jgi:hypothetical protein
LIATKIGRADQLSVENNGFGNIDPLPHQCDTDRERGTNNDENAAFAEMAKSTAHDRDNSLELFPYGANFISGFVVR